MILRERDERPPRRFNRELYRKRHDVKRLINRLKQFRRLATHYEKFAADSLAMLTLAAIMMWQKVKGRRRAECGVYAESLTTAWSRKV